MTLMVKILFLIYYVSQTWGDSGNEEGLKVIWDDTQNGHLVRPLVEPGI